MKKTSHFIFIILPLLWLFITTNAYSKSKIEDFYFLNQTFDEARLVNSGEDLLQSYSVFVLSTWLSFETKYWVLELLRKSLNPDSQLNIYSPEIMEIASVWTAGSIAVNSKYQQWPRNKILHYCLNVGGSLTTVLFGLLSFKGITIPALIIVFMTEASLAKTLSGTAATSLLRGINYNPDNFSLKTHDSTEYVVLSMAITLSSGFIIFGVLTLYHYQESPIKSVVCTSIATLSVMAFATFLSMTGLDVPLTDILTAGAAAGHGAILGALVRAAMTEAEAVVMRQAGQVTGVGGVCLAVLGAMAIAEIGDPIDGVKDRYAVAGGAIAGVRVKDRYAIAFASGAIAGALVGIICLHFLVEPNPVNHTRYSIVPTIGVASIFAFVNAIANFLNSGVPLDQTLSEISWSYWDWGDWLIHKAPDYLWTAPDSQ